MPEPVAPEPAGARIGTAIVAYIEPHPGHARAFNRWYERDHFPAAVMAGPGVFSGARFVATRACKALRPPGRRFGPPELGSYLAVAWVLPGAQAAWDTWVAGQVEALAAADRMFSHRDHLHTAVYRHRCDAVVTDGPPAAQALDHPFDGVAALAFAAGDAAARDGIDAWARALVGTAVPVAVVLEPERLVTSMLEHPGDGLDHLLVLGFVAHDVLRTWSEVVVRALDRLDDAVSVGWASPFLRTVPGTDAYASEL